MDLAAVGMESAPMVMLISPASALERLTDKEREILRLLAAGHTVKSIAAQLSRSEASINERLRDARRKAGISSSRELARLLAQKNRNEIFDLTSGATGPEIARQPPDEGRTRSKGLIMTLFALPAALAGIVLASTQPQVAVAPDRHAPASASVSPIEGKWALNIARIPAGERPREVTIDFRESGGGNWVTKVRIVAPDGTEMQSESTAALDGKAVPVSGNMPFVDSVSLRHPAPGTLVMTLSKAGAPVSTRVYAVAKEGRTMTETIVWPGTGTPALETTHFSRVE